MDRFVNTSSDKEARELLAFYLDAGADALLGEEPVDRMADEHPSPPRSRPPSPAQRDAMPAAASPQGCPPAEGKPSIKRAAPASPEAAVMAAREAAKSAGTLEELRALLDEFRRLRAARDRDPARLCRRQSAKPRHVRRRSAGLRRRHLRQAVCRPLRQAARSHDGGDRARSHQCLHRQCRAVAAAGQPHADAAGNRDLPAVHPPSDRARQSGHPGLPRRAGDANAARHQGRHHPKRAAAGFRSIPARARSGRWRRSTPHSCCAARCRSVSPGAIFWR